MEWPVGCGVNEGWRDTVDAAIGELVFRHVEQMRVVQQRLGWDAAHIKTRPAQGRLFLHTGCLYKHISGQVTSEAGDTNAGDNSMLLHWI